MCRGMFLVNLCWNLFRLLPYMTTMLRLMTTCAELKIFQLSPADERPVDLASPTHDLSSCTCELTGQLSLMSWARLSGN